MITIFVRDASGAVLARAAHESEALLCFDKDYAEGDVIEIESDTAHLWVQPDISVLPGEVYVPGGRMTWRVPFGEHRLAYRPGAFTEPLHIVAARAMAPARSRRRAA